MANFRNFYSVLKHAFFAFVICTLSLFSFDNFAFAGEETSSFGLIIVSDPDKPFYFSLAATGTFYVNCGGGTLEIHGEEDGITMAPFSEGVIEIVSGTTDPRRFGCSYDGNGKKNIYFGGLATSYNGEYQNAAISFYDEEYQENTANIDTISGDLSAIFPYNVENETHPTFYRTFYGASNARAIPSTLFSEYTVGTSHMFASTFEGCSTVTTLPDELFSNIVIGAENMFESTFKNCTGLTALPDALFSKVETGADYMFESTFAGCSTMKGTVPATLFENLIENKSDATELMKGIFDGTALETSCPEDFYQFETGYEEYWDIGEGKKAVMCESCPSGTHSEPGSVGENECLATNVPAVYTVTYNCNGGGVGFYQSVTEGTYISVNANTLSNVANCVAPSGYEFAGWYCSYGSNNVNLSTLVSILNVNTNGVMVHENLACSGVSCGFNISANTDCVVLWRTTNSCANNGTSTQYVLGNPASQFTSAMWNDSGTNTDTYYAQDTNVFPSYGSIIYERRCSTTGGIVGMSGTPSTSGGVNCWCRVKEYQPLNASSPTTMNDTPWVFVGKSDSYNACQNEGSIGGAEPGCMHACSKNAQSGSLLPVLYSTYQCQYNVTYNCGSNSSYVGSGNYAGVNPWQFVSGQTVNTSGATCSSVSGYSFSGWNCGSGIGTLAANATFPMPSNNVTCTAQWTQNAPSRYDITYDCNGGQWYSNGAQHTFVYQTSTVALTNNTGNNQSNPEMCVYSGKNFLGWTCLTSVDNYSSYVNGDSNWQYTFPTINGATSATCYATWGTTKPCAPGAMNKNSPEILGVSVGANASDMGYEWKPDITLNDLFYPASLSIGGSANISFADSDGNTWNVTLDNGLCSPTAGIPYNAGTPIENPSGDFCWCRVRGVNGKTLTGYPWVFSGVQLPNCTPNQCTSWCLEILDSLQKESDVRAFLSSLYTKISCAYNILYNCGNLPTSGNPTVNGTPPTTQTGIDPNAQAQLAGSAPNCNATGYNFSAWKCYASADTNLTNPLTVSNNTITMPEDNVMCYAKWTPGPSYSLTYNCNNGNAGGTAPTDSNSPYLYGAANISLAQTAGSCNAPANKAFNGWSCHKSGDASVPVGANGVIASMPAYDVVCDAQWDYANAHYNVTYNCGVNPDTGTPVVGGNTISVNSGSTYYINGVIGNMSVDMCSSPGSEYEFVAWVCGDTDSTFVNASVYNYNILVPSDKSTTGLPSGSWHHPIVLHSGSLTWNDSSVDTTCVAIWKKLNSCGNGTTVNYILGQEIDRNGYIHMNTYENPINFYDADNQLVYSVSYETLLSETPGVSEVPGNPSSDPGEYCWCRATAYSVNGGTQQSITNPLWINVAVNNTCVASCMGMIDFTLRNANQIVYASHCDYNIFFDCGEHGSFTSGGLYSAEPHAMTVTRGGLYSIVGSNGPGYMCTPDSGSELITSGSNIIAGGWKCVANDDPSVYLGSPNGYWTYDHNYTCTAQWVQHYSLTYDCNNGVSGQSSIVADDNLSAGDTVTLWHDSGTGYVGDGMNHSNLCTVPDNSTFSGWSCTNATVDHNTITMPSNNVICTAQWTPNAPTNYDLTYNVNAPSGVTVTNQPSQLTVSVATGTSYTLASAPTATGYTFNGWSCKDASNNSICTDSNNNAVNCGAPSSITMPESNVICTGQWDCATNYDWSNGVCVPNTYNITYHNVEDATWASVNDNPSTYTYGVGATIGVPSRQNYVFAGWCVNSSSCWGYSNNINGYTIGQNATGDYNLYARWDNVYQVSYFIGNCGAPSNGTQNYTNTSVRANDTAVFGQSYDVQLPTSSQLQLVGDTALNHYINGLENCIQFVGYYDGYAPGGDFSVDYSCNGANCGSFYPNNTYHGIPISDGSLPLYMRCNWVNYPVVYHSCDGSETFEDTGTVYSSSFSIKNYTATGLTLPSGYVFKGWSETANSATAEYPYYSNNSYTMNSCEQSGYKIHLYAVCKLNNFTLTYNVNAKSGVTVGNQPDPLSVTVTAGTSYTLASAPTATGYTFKGWSCKDQYSQSICTDSNNTAINCEASSSITMPESDVICAGQWDVNTITLLWLPDGGTPNPITTPDSCTYGMSNGITGIAQPQKPGYSFAGWEVTNWQ
jgi:uncharacterized repeat protein (TIGR02543 family)